MCGGGGNVISNIGKTVSGALKNPGKTLEGGLAGGIVGGPLGNYIGGTIGANGGSPSQALVGGFEGLPGLVAGGGNPMKIPGVGGNLGSLNPYSTVPNVYAPAWGPDQQALTGATGQVNQTQQNLYGQQQGLFNQEQQGLTGIGDRQMADTQNLQASQMKSIQDLINNQLSQETQNLTTGAEGTALKNSYNNMGLGPTSGAFQSALASRFGDIAQQGQNQLLQQGINNQNTLQGIVGGNADTQRQFQGQQQQGLSGVDTNTANLLNQLTSGSLGRQFGLEDSQSNIDLQRALAQLTGKTNTNNALIGAGGGVLGGNHLR